MSYPLLLFLITMFIVSYIFFDGLLSPTVQLVGMFVIGMFSYVVVSPNWSSDISIKTFFVITVSLICFTLGEGVSKRVKMRGKKSSGSDLIDYKSLNVFNYRIKPFWFLVLTALSAVVLVWNFKYTMQLSIAAGNVYGIEYMINFAYYAKTQLTGMPEEPQLLTFGLVLSKVFAFYCIFVLISNIKSKIFLKHLNWMCVLPIILYICQALLAGGRTQLLRFAIQFIVMFLFINKNMLGKRKPSLKGLIIIAALIFCFFAVYKAYGIMRGSMFTDNDYLFAYPASSIQALNVYLDSPTYSHAFGQETLVTVRGILSKLGFKVETYPLALEAISWQNGTTNIYTALRRYIDDYTFFGSLLIVFALGFFYGRFERRVDKSKSLTLLVLYGIMLYPIIEFLFEERFFIGVISAGTVYEIVFVALLRKIIDKQRKPIGNANSSLSPNQLIQVESRSVNSFR